jgi:hypothetical protein
VSFDSLWPELLTASLNKYMARIKSREREIKKSGKELKEKARKRDKI